MRCLWTLRRGIALGLGAVLVSAVLSACGSAPAKAPGTASVVSAPVRVAHTRLGAVGYRVVGSGPPLLLIMGFDWTMEGWDPRLVHALAQHNRVVMFDNSGVGRTATARRTDRDGHGFLFQEGPRFASRVDSFLTGHPGPASAR